MAGGGDGNTHAYADAYLFDWPSNEWLSLPNMTDAKYGFACGLIEDPALGPMVLTAGQFGSGLPDGLDICLF